MTADNFIFPYISHQKWNNSKIIYQKSKIEICWWYDDQIITYVLDFSTCITPSSTYIVAKTLNGTRYHRMVNFATYTLGTEMFAQGYLFMKWNAYVPEGGNERAFQYLILMIWRPCDLNLVMISSVASKCQDFKVGMPVFQPL